MLTQEQIEMVWKRNIGAETRSLYFADLGSRYSGRKQLITGLSFFLSSGAAASLAAKLPAWLPLALSVVVAILTAFVMAVGLDKKVQTMAKLHHSWDGIHMGYETLWNHAYEDDSEAKFENLLIRERDLSVLAVTDAPNDQRLLGEWQDRVLRQYDLQKA